jgi:ADP-heptose:LPS heptosyltransferase
MIPAQLPAHNPRILVLRLDRLGDVVLSTPVVTAIRTAHPNAHITMVVRPECRDAVEGLSALNHVVLYDKVGRERSPWGTVQFAWRLRAARFDAVLVLHPSHRSHWLAWWMGVPVRIGWNRKSGWLLTHRVPHNKQAGEQHEAQYSLDLLHYIGIRSTELMPDFPHHHEASRAIETWLAKHQIPLDRKLITIHPSASCISKLYGDHCGRTI